MPSSAFQTCARSEEHTSELQSHDNLVCRLLLEKIFSILALAEEGDEVIYPNPGFPIYESMIDYVGEKPVPIQLREEIFFFNDTATPEIFTLSLHDALPI